jgi:hypothetical protein
VGGPQAIITVYLSNEASNFTLKYHTWEEAFDRAMASIAADPYPEGWEHGTNPSKVDDDDFADCIVKDYPPFTYYYQFDTPDEITVLTITLCWPFSHTM